MYSQFIMHGQKNIKLSITKFSTIFKVSAQYKLVSIIKYKKK